jgi:hypothetical protein
MAVNGIGGGDAGSALERFQAIRDSARKKIEGGDGQANLAELIRRKQAELGASGVAAQKGTERIPAQPAAIASGSAAEALLGLTGPGYGRSGSAQKQDPKPTLGRHVDFMA